MPRTTTKKPVSTPGTRTAAASREVAAHDSYPLKTVTRMTGLSSDIIRAWERRHAVVSPLRGPRGARLYTSDDVARLRLLGDLVASGRSIGDVARLAPETLRALAHVQTPAAAADAAPAQKRIDEIVAALGRFDAISVERLLGESLIALGAIRFVTEIGAPLLERIGELWESGKLSVAEEHAASATIRSLFGGLIRMQMPARAPSLLLATPAGERHELGLSMVALLCLQAGLSVSYIGIDLPADDIVSAARATQVPVVGLSLISSANHERAVDEVRRIEAGLPRGVELWLGGRDAAKVAAALPNSRALILQSMPAVEEQIARVARSGAVRAQP
jgi:methanogenic corrinoid protein MtbC1